MKLIEKHYESFKAAYQKMKATAFERNVKEKELARFSAIMNNLIIHNGQMCYEVINELWNDLFGGNLSTNSNAHGIYKFYLTHIN